MLVLLITTSVFAAIAVVSFFIKEGKVDVLPKTAQSWRNIVTGKVFMLGKGLHFVIKGLFVKVATLNLMVEDLDPPNITVLTSDPFQVIVDYLLHTKIPLRVAMTNNVAQEVDTDENEYWKNPHHTGIACMTKASVNIEYKNRLNLIKGRTDAAYRAVMADYLLETMMVEGKISSEKLLEIQNKVNKKLNSVEAGSIYNDWGFLIRTELQRITLSPAIVAATEAQEEARRKGVEKIIASKKSGEAAVSKISGVLEGIKHLLRGE